MRIKLLKLIEGDVSDVQKKKVSGAVSTDFPMTDEKDETHQVMMEIEPLLKNSGYRTRRNNLLTHEEYPCHGLA